MKREEKKPPANFKLTEQVLLVFLDGKGREGLGFTFLSSYCVVRMEARSGPASSPGPP